jgi:hypothetical protein
MEREFDVFEILPDRSLMWHGCFRGTECVLAKLRQCSKQTLNECFAIHLTSQTILLRVNQRQRAFSAAA